MFLGEPEGHLIGGRAAIHGLGVLARSSPRLAFFLCDVLAPVAGFQRRIMTRKVKELFPALSDRTARETARGLTASTLRALVVGKCLEESSDRRHTAAMSALVRPSLELRGLRPPAILGLFHVGPLVAISVELERMQERVLGLRTRPIRLERQNVRSVTVAGDVHARGLTFRQAARHLRAGGFVSIALDSASSTAIPVPFLGRTLTLARGPFALSVLTGAPIVPVIARFHGMEIELVVGEALACESGPDCERDMATAAGRWLEQCVLESPRHSGFYNLHLLD